MSTTEPQGDSTVASAAAAERTWALILDLDTAAVDGVEALYRAYTDAFATAGITLDSVLFTRFLLGETLSYGIASLFAFLKQPKDKAAQIAEAMLAALNSAVLEAPVRATAKALVEQARKREGTIVCLTTFSPETSAKLLALLGLPEESTVVQVHPDGCGYMGADAWFRAAHTAQLPERNCIAVTATADSARGAVMSNLNVAAFVGPLTEHQDFSGVDWRGTGSSAKEAEAILNVLFERL